MTEHVRIMTWNVNEVGERPPLWTWSPVAELVKAHSPDIVLFQELSSTGRSQNSRRTPDQSARVDQGPADRLGAELDMHVAIADSPLCLSHTAIAWSRSLELKRWQEIPQIGASSLLYSQSVAVIGDPRWLHPLSLASVHLNPFLRPVEAVREAGTIASLVTWYSPWTVFGGDLNAAPLGDTPPPLFVPSCKLELDLRVAHRLAQEKLVDAAAHLADQRQDPSLRAPTGQDQVRVDQFHLSQPLIPGLRDYQRLSPQGLSNNSPLLIDLDLPTAP